MSIQDESIALKSMWYRLFQGWAVPVASMHSVYLGEGKFLVKAQHPWIYAA